MAVIDSRKSTTVDGISTVDGEAYPSSKRRSMRVVIDIPVTVFGQNSDGKIFEEKTKTVTVNAHGGLVTLKTAPDPQKPVLLVNIKTGAEVQCRVAAFRKEIEEGQLEVGLEFAQPLPRFWGINFPPEDWNPADRKKPTLSRKPISSPTKGTNR